MRPGALLLLTIAAAAGCTTANSVPAPSATCPSTVIALCQAACACASDASQTCSIGDSFDGTVGTRATFASENACELYFAFACGEGGPPAGFDFAACSSALPSATCTATIHGPALLFPPACNVSLPDGGVDSSK